MSNVAIPIVPGGGGGSGGGTGLTPAQLAKLNALPSFAPRVEIITAGVAAVAAVPGSAATAVHDLELTSTRAEIRLTALAPGTAANGVRFRVTVGHSSTVPNFAESPGSNGRDWQVLLRMGDVYSLGNIISIINPGIASGVNPPCTVEAVSALNVVIGNLQDGWAGLAGGVDDVPGVDAVDEVTETHQPADGDVMVFTGTNTAVNNKALRYGPVSISSYNVVSSIFNRGTNPITLKSTPANYEFNVGEYFSGSFHEASWIKLNHEAWLDLAVGSHTGVVGLNNALYVGDILTLGVADLYIGRDSNNVLLLSSSNSNSDILPFSIREAL